MKTLKIKFGLFSLLAILAVSVFFTACEQDAITDILPETVQHSMDNIVAGDYIAAPYDIMSSVSNYLSADEIQGLGEYTVNEGNNIDSRGCGSWVFSCYYATGASGGGQCQYYAIYVRNCGSYYQGGYSGPHSTDCSTVHNNEC